MLHACLHACALGLLQSTRTRDVRNREADRKQEGILSAILFTFQKAVAVSPAFRFETVVLLFPFNITINL